MGKKKVNVYRVKWHVFANTLEHTMMCQTTEEYSTVDDFPKMISILKGVPASQIVIVSHEQVSERECDG